MNINKGLVARLAVCVLTVTTISTAQNAGAYASYTQKYSSYSSQYYVSASGSGSTCSASSPCSLQTALDLGNTGIGKAGAGTVIWFNDGTYNLSSHFTTKASGTSTAHAAYVALNYGGPQFVLNPSTETGWPLWELQGSYVDIVGLDMSTSGTNAGNECGAIQSNYPSVYGNNTYAYNRIHDFPSNTTYCGNGTGGGGIVTGSGTSGSSQNTIANNLLWNIGANQNVYVHGIYADGSNDLISNNLVYQASGVGIQIYHNAQSETIVNNTLASNGCWGIIAGAYQEPSMTGMDFANNVIINTATGSNACTNGGRAGFAECDGSGCSGASGNTITNNLFYNNYANVNIPSGGTDTSINMVQSNPTLISIASPSSGGNFRFQAGSPAIGAGTTTNAPTLDVDGNSRPSDPSIGAYDVGASFVQQCSAKSPSNAVTSLSCTMPKTVTSGDLLVAMDCYITPEGSISVTDTNSDTYTSAVQDDDTPDIIGCNILYTANAVGGSAPTFTVHSTTATNHWFAVNEYSGILTSNPLDVTGSGAANGTHSQNAATNNLTTTTNNELLVADAVFGQGSATAGSGYTPRFAQSTILPEDKTVMNSGTYTATESSTLSTGWVIVAAAFEMTSN